jgi:hypothetical protein
MKTRLWRWKWSSIRPCGLPLEYVGGPLEKLLGVFIAVVIIAFFIGAVNLIMMFANLTAYAVSFIGVIPIYFCANYRVRWYVLAHTRWRGVRFGLEPSAWGFSGGALVLFLVERHLSRPTTPKRPIHLPMPHCRTQTCQHPPCPHFSRLALQSGEDAGSMEHLMSN